MPSYFVHLCVAKKVNPNASLDFFIGTLAPDSVSGKEKHENHFRDKPNMELALKKFAKTIDTENQYLKGFLLHLFVDWKWNDTILADFAKSVGDGWYKKYHEEVGLIESYGTTKTPWLYALRQEMLLYSDYDFVETGFVSRQSIKTMLDNSDMWKVVNKTNPSLAFPCELIENFATNIAQEFAMWFSELELL